MKQKNYLIAFICFFLTTNFYAENFYVSADGNDTTGNGEVGSPYLTISHAVEGAASGDTIFVVGTVDQSSQIAFNKAISFEGISNAVINGNTNRLFNITSNSGVSISFSDITFQSMNSSFQGAVLNNTLQSGMTFTFTNCNFLDNSTSSTGGGGVFYFGQNPTVNLTRCTFNNNEVVTSTAPTARGGAIQFSGSTTATITNCTFSNNKIAKNDNFGGAAIRVNDGGCVITISNSLFYNNKANNGSGGNSDFNGVGGAEMNFTNSLAAFTNNIDTSTGSDLTADFTNTTFTFTSPNLTYTAPTSISDDTPIDFGSDNSDAGSWNSNINLFETGSDWATAANWSSTAIPLATDNVTLLSDSPALVVGATTGAVANDVAVNASSSLTINSGGSLIVNGSSSGDVTYNRNLGTDNWYLVSSPVNGEIMTDMRANNSFADGTAGNRIGFAPYATSSDDWSYFTTSSEDALVNGKGYSAKLSTPGPISFTGNINTTDVTVSVVTGGAGGFNLIGNPYTSHINSATFLTENTSNLVTQDIWIWNQATENYEVKTTTDTFVLAPAQGFFVRANSNASLNFIETNQADNGGTFQKSSKTEVKLMMNDGSANRFAKLYYLENVTKGFDNGFDGETFGGIENSVDVFTNLLEDNQGKKYQVQSLPISEIENMVIPLGVKAAASKEITFSADALNLPSAINVFLEDRFTNTFTRLDETNSEYKVTLTETLNGVGRFYIHTTESVLSAEGVILNSVRIFKTDASTLKIKGLPKGKTSFYLYNMLGKEMITTIFTSNGNKEISLSKLASGIYVAKMQTEKGAISKKIILE